MELGLTLPLIILGAQQYNISTDIEQGSGVTYNSYDQDDHVSNDLVMKEYSRDVKKRFHFKRG